MIEDFHVSGQALAHLCKELAVARYRETGATGLEVKLQDAECQHTGEDLLQMTIRFNTSSDPHPAWSGVIAIADLPVRYIKRPQTLPLSLCANFDRQTLRRVTDFLSQVMPQPEQVKQMLEEL